MSEGMFIPDMVEEDDGGIAADHAPRLTLPVLAAPFPETQKSNVNTIRRSLVCVACKDVPGSHYAFDSSILAPESKKGFAALKPILDRHPGSPLSIFGHADPEGSEVYNKFLSERRAEVVFGMLIRDVPTWERLFSHHENTPGDVWGDSAVELMLRALDFTADANNKEKFGDVIKRYQIDRGISPSGRNDTTLRAKLFAEYMDFLCSDDKGTPFQLTKADFLGEGAKHGAFQGCSEFNPQLVLAKVEEDGFKADTVNGKDDRAAANFDNRRAIIYLFRAGSKIDPAKWPCPLATEGIGKCVSHFWSDGNDRKGKLIADKRRRFGKAVRDHTERIAQIEKTFACRFYHGLAQHSPCERDLQMWVLQLLVDGPREPGKETGLEQKPLANVRYVIRASQEVTAPILRGATSSNGVIGIPLWVPIAQMTLKVDMLSAMLGSLPPAPDKKSGDDGDDAPVAVDLETSVDSDQFKDEDLFIAFPLFGGNLKRIVRKSGGTPDNPQPEPDALEPDAGEPPVAPDEQRLGARQRLYNLGYGVAEPAKWTDAQLTQFVKRFQKDKKLQVTGALDTPTIDRLRKEYGS
jgi:hypothetical protein